MEQLLLHLVGDYVIQNDWMALNKKINNWKGEFACQLHSITYTLPFLLLTTNWKSLFLIYASHYILDRNDIVTTLLSLKNTGKWKNDNFGFNKTRPKFITIWLNIITDNTIHLVINYLILRFQLG